MKRITEGIIDVNGFELTPNTTLEELENIDIDVGVLRTHPHGYLEVIFNRPVESDGVKFRVSVRLIKKNKSMIALLDPILSNPAHNIMEESRLKQEVCEEWMKRNIEIPPTRDTDDGIFYDFDWGRLYSAAAEHINFGNLEGCIKLAYGEAANEDE